MQFNTLLSGAKKLIVSGFIGLSLFVFIFVLSVTLYVILP